LSVNTEKWLDECELISEHYANFGTHLPKELAEEFVALKNRLR
jgi:phosphoenolpyruvate carboxykinase (GTP)